MPFHFPTEESQRGIIRRLATESAKRAKDEAPREKKERAPHAEATNYTEARRKSSIGAAVSIVRAIAISGSGTVAEIQKASGTSSDTVARVLNEMVDQGLLEKSSTASFGRAYLYRIPE